MTDADLAKAEAAVTATEQALGENAVPITHHPFHIFHRRSLIHARRSPAAHLRSHVAHDFFIHIATIVIGLLIAVGLEQTVESHVHHHREVAETRKALEEEHGENIRRFHRNVRDHLGALARLHKQFARLAVSAGSSRNPQDKLPGVLSWPQGAEEPLTAALSTAQHTAVLTLLPPEEVRRRTSEYFELDYAWQRYQPVVPILARCTTYLTHTADPTTLRPSEIAGLVDCVEQAQTMETIYGDELSAIGDDKEFGPVPSYWKMIPYFKMGESLAWNDAHPEVAAQTKKDIQQALASDPAGPAAQEKSY